jgi:hypothetical protein
MKDAGKPSGIIQNPEISNSNAFVHKIWWVMVGQHKKRIRETDTE